MQTFYRSRSTRRQRRHSYRARSSVSREREREWKKQRWNKQMEEQKKQWVRHATYTPSVLDLGEVVYGGSMNLRWNSSKATLLEMRTPLV